MPNDRSPILGRSERLAFVLLAALLVSAWCAGGSSRADALGQTVSRAAAWAVVIAAVLFLPPPNLRRARPVMLIFLGALVLVALQLLPLPPTLWAGLPGHAMLAQVAVAADIQLPWLPMTISREATLNALGSLIVPGACLMVVTTLPAHAYRLVVGLLMLLIVAASVLGLFQFTGAEFDHPLINDRAGEVGGPFANRNHFALFAATGTVFAPAFAFASRRVTGARLALAAGFHLLCFVVILIIGSRAGLLLGALGTILGLSLVRHELRSYLQRYSPKIKMVAALGSMAILGGVGALTVTMGRAQSLARFTEDGTADGLRGAVRPTVLDMIEKYFPFGSGFGTFDPAYRIDEPIELLRPNYVNLAHNDLIQIPLDGGLPGLLLMLVGLAWFVRASGRAWGRPGSLLGRLGSAILFLVIVASAMDYPARTPMIMLIMTIAAVWLAISTSGRAASVKPER